jgi:hypothetical protein
VLGQPSALQREALPAEAHVHHVVDSGNAQPKDMVGVVDVDHRRKASAVRECQGCHDIVGMGMHEDQLGGASQ